MFVLIFCWTMLDKFVENNSKFQKSIFDQNQSCSYCDSVQDAPIIKFWGPLFDGFVDISIFMIWGSLGVVWLDVPDPTSVLGGSVPSGGYFSSKTPF